MKTHSLPRPLPVGLQPATPAAHDGGATTHRGQSSSTPSRSRPKKKADGPISLLDILARFP